MVELVQALQQLDGPVVVPSMQFVEDAVTELVLGRHVLIASYAYGYRIVIRRVQDKFEQIQVSVLRSKPLTVSADYHLQPPGKTGGKGRGTCRGCCSATPPQTSLRNHPDHAPCTGRERKLSETDLGRHQVSGVCG